MAGPATRVAAVLLLGYCLSGCAAPGVVTAPGRDSAAVVQMPRVRESSPPPGRADPGQQVKKSQAPRVGEQLPRVATASPSGSASPPAKSAPPTPAATSASPPAAPVDGGGGAAWWLVGGVAVVVVGAAAAALAALSRRRTEPAAGPVWTPQAPRGGPRAFEPPPATTAPPALVDALRRVAASGVSAAIVQQVDRLLARPGVDRDALVHAAIRYRDQLARDEGLRGELLRALNAVGVREVVVGRERFDGRVHEAVEAIPAPSQADHDLVAETVRCGYVDRDRVLRPPRVVVYRAGEAFPTERR